MLLGEADRAELATRILQAHHQLLQALHRNRPGWLELDLSMSQVRAILALSQDGSMPVGVLAERLGVGISAASQLVERLVQHHLVERQEDPRDRRRMLVQLSAHGQEIDTRFREAGERQMRTWLSQLSGADLAALAHGLQALAAATTHEESVTTPLSPPLPTAN
jgi:DNA-binding MarR family transcriptional regulator